MTSTRKPGAGRPPLENPPQVYNITLRCYPGQDDDLIGWLDALPSRARASAVRARLRTGAAPQLTTASGIADTELDDVLDGLIF